MAFFVALFAALAVCAASQSPKPCPTVRPTTIMLSVEGRLNKTGHWNKDVSVKYQGQKSPATWDVDFQEDLSQVDSYSFIASAKVQGSVHVDEDLPSLRYVYRGDVRNFSDAFSVCQQMGARMAVIHSLRESQFLVNLVQRSRNAAATHAPYTFVGLFFDNQWRTTDGDALENVGFSTWEAGQPSNSSFIMQNGIRVFENCGTMGRTGYLNDSPCEVRLPFICEFEKETCMDAQGSEITTPPAMTQ